MDTSSNGNRIGSRTNHNHLLSENICADLTVKPGGGHGIYADANGTRFRTARASCFFKGIFCNSCTNHYDTTVVLPDCSTITTIEEVPSTNEWLISPNPFHDYLNVSNLTGNEKTFMYSLNGTLLFDDIPINSQNFAQLAPGMYILIIKSNTKMKHFKIIKA